MSEPERPNSLTEQLRAALDQRTADIDSAVLQRLDAARAEALEALETRQAHTPTGWQTGLQQWINRYTLVPAGGLATAALVAMVWLNTAPPTTHPGVQDFELLSADTSLDLLEDMEFAEWLLFHQEDDPHVSG